MSPWLDLKTSVYGLVHKFITRRNSLTNQATYKACHVTSVLCEFFCKSISLYTIRDSKYCLMFFGTFEFDNISGIGK